MRELVTGYLNLTVKSDGKIMNINYFNIFKKLNIKYKNLNLKILINQNIILGKYLSQNERTSYRVS